MRATFREDADITITYTLKRIPDHLQDARYPGQWNGASFSWFSWQLLLGVVAMLLAGLAQSAQHLSLREVLGFPLPAPHTLGCRRNGTQISHV